MSFSKDIYGLMVKDTSLNGLVKGIYYEYLPANVDMTDDYIVFSYNKGDSVNTLGFKNVITYWSLLVNAMSPDTEKLNIISDRLSTYLTSIDDSSTGIRQISFESETRGINNEMTLCQNIQQYSVTVFN